MLDYLFGSQIAYADDPNGVDATVQLVLSNQTDLLSLLVYPILIAIVPIAFSVFLNRRTNKKIRKSEYSNNRSEYVTRNRFDKEIDSIQNLSMNLLLLIQKTKSVVALSKPTSAEAVDGTPTEDLTRAANEWEAQREKVIRSIGKAAPFLNYLDLQNSSISFCGVNRKGSSPSVAEREGANHGSQHEKSSLPKSCACVRKEITEKSLKEVSPTCQELEPNSALVEIQSSSDDSLFIDYLKGSTRDGARFESDKVGKNLYQRACEILLFCEYAKRNKDLGCVQPQGACDGNAGSPHEYRTYLDCRYERFINCAYCRLNTIEYGRESLREKNKREHKRQISWRGRRKESKMRSFDQACPYKQR